MGVAAYSRASKVVSARIVEAYDLSGKDVRSLIERAEILIKQFDQFSRNAQNLFWDSVDDGTSKGLLRGLINRNYKRKRTQSAFVRRMTEAVAAHTAWVNADRRQTLEYLKASRRKALAWREILGTLNKAYHLPFSTPNF